MRVSTRGDYACRALLSLALHDNGETPTSVRDIAERTALPQPYLEQILLALKGAGLVRSKRGVGGGYVLARPPAEITLAEVVSAVDGPIQAGDRRRRRLVAPLLTEAARHRPQRPEQQEREHHDQGNAPVRRHRRRPYRPSRALGPPLRSRRCSSSWSRSCSW